MSTASASLFPVAFRDSLDALMRSCHVLKTCSGGTACARANSSRVFGLGSAIAEILQSLGAIAAYRAYASRHDKEQGSYGGPRHEVRTFPRWPQPTTAIVTAGLPASAFNREAIPSTGLD